MTPIETPDRELVERIRAALPVNRAPAIECPRCNPTAKAYALVEAQWVVAGMDLKDGDVSAPIYGNEKARLQSGFNGDAHP